MTPSKVESAIHHNILANFEFLYDFNPNSARFPGSHELLTPLPMPQAGPLRGFFLQFRVLSDKIKEQIGEQVLKGKKYV